MPSTIFVHSAWLASVAPGHFTRVILTFRSVVAVFTRMLDNVVEVNGLPLEKQREEIMRKRRHGMGFLGLGSTITMLGWKYGSRDAVATYRAGLLDGWYDARHPSGAPFHSGLYERGVPSGQAGHRHLQLDRAAEGFRRNLAARGPNALGIFSCSKSTNEVNYVAQKFMRLALGTNHIDSCNRT